LQKKRRFKKLLKKKQREKRKKEEELRNLKIYIYGNKLIRRGKERGRK